MAATVLILDDHAGFRLSARRILEADGYEVIGEAGDGRSAIEAALRLRPKVVLLDVNLPDMDGFEVARQLAQSDPPRPAIVLTSSHDREDFGDSLPASSAAGFVPKDELTGAAVAAPVPVEVTQTLQERLPAPVEAAAYFVVAEALTNVARYAEASRAKVSVERGDSTVTVSVIDDGMGGADPAAGSGLRGLADRLATLDGTLAVVSPSGEGTTVKAVIPCA
jgi:CheY-like chemotaxis protein